MAFEIVLGLAMLIVAIWAMKDPFIGLLGLIGISIINPGELFPIFDALHVQRIFAIIVFASAFFRGGLKLPPVTRALIIFWAVMFAGVPFAYFKGGALSKAIDFSEPFLYHLLAVSLIDTRERLKTFVSAYAVLVGWIAGGALYGYAHGSFDAAALRNGLQRAQGLTSSGGDPNTVGLTLISSLPLIVLVIAAGRPFLKLVTAACAGCCVIAIVLTGSRTAFLLLAGGLVFFFLTRKHRFILMPLALLVFVVGWALVPDTYKTRISSVEMVANGKHDQSYENRLKAWHAGVRMFEDYPFFGVGKGQFANANGAQYFEGSLKLWLQPHNMYVQLMAELGLFGIAAFLWFHVKVWQATLAARRQVLAGNESRFIRYLPTAVIFSLCMLYVSGYSSHTLYRSTWYMLAALMASLQWILQNDETKKEELLPALEAVAL